MKTKHLLFCAAIGAAFTACTADEDLVLQNNNAANANLAIRPVVGAEISLGGSVDSRLAIGTGVRPVFESVDALGAAVIDVPLYADAEDYETKKALGWASLYDIVEYYGCNNAFTTDNAGSTWTAEQAMVEGNYLFYAPYNEEMGLRTPMTVAVPRVQNASTDRKALEDYYADVKNVAMVGYKGISGAETKRPSVEMYNIFAYPEFTITNNFDGYLFAEGKTEEGDKAAKAWNGAVKLDSIQFVNVGATRSPISTTQIGGLLCHENIATELTATGDWADAKKLLNAKTTDLLHATNGKIVNNRHNQAGVITTAIVGRTIEQGASIKVACVMPAMSFNFSDNQLLAKLYFTIDGKNYVMYDGATFAKLTDVITDTQLDDDLSAQVLGYAMDAKEEVGLSSLTLVAGQRVAGEAINVKNGAYQLKPESGRTLLNIELVGGQPSEERAETVQIMSQTSIDAVALTGVTTTEQLISLIENAANGTAWTEVTEIAKKSYKIESTNTVEINAALIDALSDYNNNPGGAFAMKSVVPVANDVTVTAVTGNVVTFTSDSGKSYNIELIDAITDNTPTSNAEYLIVNAAVNEGAKLAGDVIIWAGTTSDANLTLNANAAIKSLHTAKIMSGSTNTVKPLSLVLTDYKFTATYVNNASALSVAGTNATTAVTMFDNEGDLTVSGAKFDTSKTVLVNNGTIDVTANSTLNVNSGNGKVYLAEVAVNSILSVASAQYVEFVTTDALSTTQIEKAEALGYVDAINVTGTATLAVADIAKFGDIKSLILNGNVTFGQGTFDLTGFSVKLGANQTWTGNALGTTVSGLGINLNAKTLTLTTIYVNASRTGSGSVVADGYTSKWNLGGSVTYTN